MWWWCVCGVTLVKSVALLSLDAVHKLQHKHSIFIFVGAISQYSCAYVCVCVCVCVFVCVRQREGGNKRARQRSRVCAFALSVCARVYA